VGAYLLRSNIRERPDPLAGLTQPDSAQAMLLDRLGIVLPKRMRLPQPKWPTLVATA
jgi:hypothetical protein